jgi:quercetin 2,3-dioxygenase
LNKKESFFIKNKGIAFSSTDTEAGLVLFVTEENTEVYDEGMYSGNQM